MFHRRPRTPSNARVNHDPTPSAATAAAQAFLANRVSNAQLSAAAAAAALRSHTTSPVPVADIQTKRTVRRQGSIGSIGSAGGNVNGRGLRRQGSSGSMSDRTFRDQSPGRSPSRGRVDSPPPVPALPKQLPPVPRTSAQTAGQRPATSSGVLPPPLPQKSQKRASSVEAPFARVASPPPNQTTGRGLSIDTNRVASPGLVAAQRASSIAAIQGQGLPPRPESRGSVNFSYPISPRSPTPSMDERRTGSGPIWNQQSPVRVASPVSPGVTKSNAAHGVQSGTQQAPKLVKKKNPVIEKDTRGRQSENGDIATQAARNLVSSGGPGSPSNGPEAAIPKRMNNKVASPSVTLPDRPPSVASYHSDLDTISEDGDAPERQTRFKTRAAALLVKHPSVVRENRELEERAEAADNAKSPLNVTKKPQVKQTVAAGSPKANGPTIQTREGQMRNPGSQPTAGNYAKTNQHARSSSQPAPVLQETPVSRTGLTNSEDATRKASAGRGKATGRGGRPQSLSPTRYAHFAAAPPTSSPLVVKHEPPPRSLSPAKSAMRKSPSSRPNSAASQNSNAGYAGYGQAANDPSDTSIISEDGNIAGPRKKNARVSFDEESVVIGGGDSPTIPAQSPYRKGTAESFSNDTADNILTPTPALPSFGSLRDRKDKDGDKRISEAPSLSPAPLQASSDHAIGALLLQDSRRKGEGADGPANNVANGHGVSKINQGPEITPVRMTDGSDTDGSMYSDGGQGQNGHIASDVGFPTDVQAKSYSNLSKVPVEDINSGVAQFNLGQKYDVVPSIEFTQPTPSLEQAETVPNWSAQTVANPQQSESITGGKGDYEDETQHKPLNASPALAGLAEPEPEEAARNHSPGTPTVGHFAEDLRTRTDHQSEGNDDDDQSSVYSDAAEDLTGAEGDGFGSIDAVVDSPTIDTRPEIAAATPPESPTSKLTNRQTGKDNSPVQTNGTDPGPSAQEGWNQTQAYRSSGNGRQKQELERDAAPSASDNVVEPLKPQAKKRKKVTSPVNQVSQTPAVQPPVVTAKKTPLPTGPKPKQGQAVPSSNSGNVKGPVSLRPQNVNPSTQLPKTMRGGPTQTHMQQSRPATSPAKNALRPETGDLKAARRARPESTPDTFSTAVQRELRNMNAPAMPPSKTAVPRKERRVLGRTKSSDSDSSASSSSFRKKSRPISSSSGGMALRRTMRTGSQSEAMDPGNRSSRFSMRSLSPAGSTTRRPFSPPPSMGHTNKGTMKMSLRGPQGSSMPTLRPQSAGQAKPASTFTGFGRIPKGKGKPSRSGGQQRSRRFSDSSDEGMPSNILPTFRSRFDDDSSDEEGGPVERLTPVRGIPRRIGEEDKESSDLPDSSEDERRVLEPSKATKSKNPETSGTSTALALGSLRHNDGSGMDLSKGADAQRRKEKDKDKGGHKRRRSFFFAALGRRHRHHDEKKFETVQEMMTAAEAERRREMNEDGEPTQITTNGVPASSPPSTPRPKLTKRSSSMAQSQSQYPEEDSWPIPTIPSTQPSTPLKSALIRRPEEDRPTTSDGVPPSSRRTRSLWGGAGKHVHLPHPHLRHHDVGDSSGTARPDMGRRRVTLQDPLTGADELADDGGGRSEKRTRKKKRFGALRRAFGLHD